MTIKARTLTTLSATLVALLFSVSLASAAEPWWHLNSGARPTYLHYESGLAPGQDEVQELSIEPNTFFKLTVNHEKVAFFESEPNTGPNRYDDPHATAAEVQAKLEGEAFYGAGNVEVTGQGPEGLPPLLVKSEGADADSPVPALEVPYVDTEEGYTGNASARVLTPGRAAQSDGVVVGTVVNLGDAAPDGPVRVVDRLPAGLEAVGVEGRGESGLAGGYTVEGCSLERDVMNPAAPPVAVCVLPGESATVAPYALFEMRVAVRVTEAARSGESNEVSVSGGGTPAASIRRPVTISSEKTPFGLEGYELTPEEEGGGVDTQAGSHPFQTTFTVRLNENTEVYSGAKDHSAVAAGMAKDIHDRLPAGMIGNPKPFATCTDRQFLAKANECPEGSVVGVAIVTLGEPGYIGTITNTNPVFNLEPAVGEPARFGFLVRGHENPVYLDTSIRTGENYGIEVDSNNIPQKVSFVSSYITIWGVPGDARHDSTRDGCLASAQGNASAYPPCQSLDAHNPPPFLELPTSCPTNPLTHEPEPLQSSVEADSWEEPGGFTAPVFAAGEPALDGCNRLPFEPSLEVEADGDAASTPTGLAIDQHIGQEVSLTPTGLGESDVRDVTVTFPEGVVINPSGADGLEACGEGLIGYEPGESTPPEELHFTRTRPGSPGSSERFESGVDFCPDASKIGTVKIQTPILSDPLEGAVYLASQNSNPFGSLVAVYIVAEDPTAGVLVKLPGEVSLNPRTGQITTTFLDLPQAPFETAEFHLFGGERAPLATPAHCGTYTTKVVFTPWAGDTPVTTESPFQITSGPDNTPCPGPTLPFDPSVTGGATNLQAGAFSPLTVSVNRSDGEQDMKSIVAKLPPGLSGVLTGVELCPEPQANEGECPAGSLVGEATVGVGVGGHPFTVTGGRFYLTGPYNGSGGCTVGEPGCAPFGLTFEVPAKAGPFDLKRNTANPAGEDPCDCVIVRGKIELNPITSAITITSDPPGSPYSIPTSIEGIPLEIQHINATTTRGDFQFNPTNCSKMALEGIVQLSEGGSDTITTPFQVTNCAALGFAPKFAVSTSAKTSRSNGASLSVHLTYPKAPFGSQANIAKVKVELPKALPSRLTTLQKACSSAQFNANPAGCPPASVVGHAKATTPLIPVPLEGPAYFVSHGGEAFPSLIIVLQGYGVTIDLIGSTFINEHTGVTSSTFKTVPDQPVNTFELTLPEGQYSALAANKNLCKTKLTMPTEFIAQNGAQTHQSTKITVTGCPKHKAKHTKKTKKKTKKTKPSHKPRRDRRK